MIVAGFGYRSTAKVSDLLAALEQTGQTADALASVAAKATGPLADLADQLNLPLIAVDEAQIAHVTTPTQSERIQNRFATGSLAEAAALVAAGPGAEVIVPRVSCPNGLATAAIAEGHTP
ncbi:cobalamin biosynthesis protein [Roseovarius sp. 2305UL8-3]|uniref:cobalamin biosynthesis protein n=1 Tax=Roseovarius conchicola TaxID=3121636 RepID=UPI00352710AD